MKPANTCDNCNVWLPDNEARDVGLCRRNPPIPILIPATADEPARITSFFPKMAAGGWCSKHKHDGSSSTTGL